MSMGSFDVMCALAERLAEDIVADLDRTNIRRDPAFKQIVEVRRQMIAAGREVPLSSDIRN